MSLNRFKTLADAYGAERRRWPQVAHALYDSFANTADGIVILAEADRIDRFLDTFESPAFDDAIAHRIADQATADTEGRTAVASDRVVDRFRWQLALFAASAIICVGVGFGTGFAQSAANDPPDLVAQLLLNPVDVQEIDL